MKNTALEQLIEKWETEIGSFIPNAPIYEAFIKEAKVFVGKQKQQIIDAYKKGYEQYALNYSETGANYPDNEVEILANEYLNKNEIRLL